MIQHPTYMLLYRVCLNKLVYTSETVTVFFLNSRAYEVTEKNRAHMAMSLALAPHVYAISLDVCLHLVYPSLFVCISTVRTSGDCFQFCLDLPYMLSIAAIFLLCFAVPY